MLIKLLVALVVTSIAEVVPIRMLFDPLWIVVVPTFGPITRFELPVINCALCPA